MTDDEDRVLVLMPARPGIHVTAGSVQITAGCGHQAWMAPSSVVFAAANPDLKTICLKCAEPGHRLEEVPGSRQELRREIGPAADAIIDYLTARRP